jgi:pimeloyl-ACP methyl ester carboxylesterase
LSEHGIAIAVGQWMATNLEQKQGMYHWRFDLESIEALLHDFFATDLWDVIESPGDVQIEVVKAKESGVLTPQAVQRVQAAAQAGHVHYHEVDGGHWVNAENPDALLELLRAEL